MAKLPDGGTVTAQRPRFEAPWHAQVFAMTVHLNAQGVFDWPSWTEAFSQTLRRHGLSKSLDGGDDYFLAWLETLEAMTNSTGQTDAAELARLKSAWEEAYLATPHGQPVTLS